MEILKRDSLQEGGFAGLKEHRLVKEPRLFGPQENNDGSWPGIGNFVYLADARFMPHGETRMHSHHEIDVISVMVDGNIKHEGSLEDGQNLVRDNVQVQRAGGEGFSHNEINPDDDWNRMIQLWVLPEIAGQPAGYKVFKPVAGELTRIYGGGSSAEEPSTEELGGRELRAEEHESDIDFPAKTKIDVALLGNGHTVEVNEPFIAYITRGTGVANDEQVADGDIIRGDALKFEAMDDVQLIVIHAR